MFDIDLDDIELEKLINKLEIDKSDCNSNCKTRLDNGFIPYLKE